MATERESTPELALDMRDIGKRFGEEWVLRHVDFGVRQGSIHGVVGHNGAGKSTLMKIALGGYPPTEGTVMIRGQRLTFQSPAEARRLGVGMVLQERSLIGTLTGLDNVFLNAERVNRAGLLRKREEALEAEQLCAELGISPAILRRRVSEMSQLDQELLEIAKAIRIARNVLILDEPTAPLTAREIETLFGVIRSVAALGIGIILITHHLSEVFQISDEVTVLREGEVTLRSTTADMNLAAMIDAMLGKRFMRIERQIAESEAGERLPSQRGAPPTLEVRDLHVAEKFASGVSFSLYPGEILGVAGLAGSGRTTLLRALYGDVRPSAGSMLLHGKPYAPKSPRDAIDQNIFLIPEDRGVHGLVLTAALVENTILPILNRIARYGLVQIGKGRQIASEMTSALGIRSRGTKQIVGQLSGGNQQKVVLAKALASQAELLLLDEPTFGVDIGAAGDLISRVRQLVEEGHAALWATSDVRELLEVSDRVMILTGGTIQRTITRFDADFNEAAVIHAMQRGQVQSTALSEAHAT